MSMTLLVRPQPLRWEGLRGYLLRLAEVNGLLPEVDLYQRLFGRRGATAATKRQLAKAADWIGIPLDDLASLGCHGFSTNRARCSFAGHRMSLAHQRSNQCCICPDCMSAEPAVKADWELRSIVTCAIHGCWLIDCCPRCKQAISWRRQGVCRCQCGFDFRRAPRRAAPESVCVLTQVLTDSLRGDIPARIDGRGGLPEELIRLSIDQLLGTIQFFGNKRFRELAIPPQLGPLSSSSLHEQARKVEFAAHALSDWPLNWNNTLHSVVNRNGENVNHTWRRLTTAMEARSTLIALERVKWSTAVHVPGFLRSNARKYLTTRTVSVGRQRLYLAGAHPQIRSGATDPACRLAQLWSMMTNSVALHTDRVSPNAARQLLGASATQVSSLIRLGVLRCMSHEATISEVDQALKALNSGASARRKTDPTSYISLQDVQADESLAFDALLSAVLERKVPSVHRTECRPSGLGNLFVPAACLAQFGLEIE